MFETSATKWQVLYTRNFEVTTQSVTKIASSSIKIACVNGPLLSSFIMVIQKSITYNVVSVQYTYTMLIYLYYLSLFDIKNNLVGSGFQLKFAARKNEKQSNTGFLGRPHVPESLD